ncbi:MAG: 4Fe-4S dicluster domain-containing protein, partial [Thermoleophilia bacterium]|nr:4Fe-4S dicluster domain-containing protein [Thermoleophilia bacterium]
MSAYSWDFCLIQYNFLDVEFQAGRTGLRHAAEKGLGVMVMEPVKGGRLAGRIPAAVQALWDQAPIKREPAEWALRFVWNEPEVSLVLSGMSSLEQVQKNVAWVEAGTPGSLSHEELDIVERVRQEYRRRLRVACTGCGYCKPCPAGIDIPFMLDCLNNLACFEDLVGVNFSYNFSVKAGNTAAASACEACGQCEDACPQHLPIMA